MHCVYIASVKYRQYVVKAKYRKSQLIFMCGFLRLWICSGKQTIFGNRYNNCRMRSDTFLNNFKYSHYNYLKLGGKCPRNVNLKMVPQ